MRHRYWTVWRRLGWGTAAIGAISWIVRGDQIGEYFGLGAFLFCMAVADLIDAIREDD